MTGNRLWVFGTVVAMAVVVVLGWFLGISPKLAEAEAANAQVAAVATQNIALEAALADLRQQNDRIGEIEDELDTLRATIPGTVDSAELIETVSALLAARGLTVVTLTLADAVAYGSVVSEVAPDATETAEPPPTAPDGLYTVRLTLEASGTGAGFLLFVRDLQEQTRLVIVPNAEYTADKQTGTLTAYAFVMPSQGRPAGGGGGSSAPSPSPSATPAPDPSETPAP